MNKSVSFIKYLDEINTPDNKSSVDTWDFYIDIEDPKSITLNNTNNPLKIIKPIYDYNFIHDFTETMFDMDMDTNDKNIITNTPNTNIQTRIINVIKDRFCVLGVLTIYIISLIH